MAHSGLLWYRRGARRLLTLLRRALEGVLGLAGDLRGDLREDRVWAMMITQFKKKSNENNINDKK